MACAGEVAKLCRPTAAASAQLADKLNRCCKLPASLVPSDLCIDDESDGVAPWDGGDLHQHASVRVQTGMQ